MVSRYTTPLDRSLIDYPSSSARSDGAALESRHSFESAVYVEVALLLKCAPPLMTATSFAMAILTGYLDARAAGHSVPSVYTPTLLCAARAAVDQCAAQLCLRVLNERRSRRRPGPVALGRAGGVVSLNG